jgi:excisionase family DNA binding protein
MATTSPSRVDRTRDSSAASEALQRESERLLTITDVAEWLGVSKAWVYDHVTRKKPLLPCVRFGEITRFRREEIENFIQAHVRRNSAS